MYEELVTWLFSFPGRRATTFDAMQRLDEKLGQPHTHFKSIHVGGTNGKGSVAMKIAKSLEAEGLKVGLYTSPHIADFRERILVNGEMIEKGAVARLLKTLFFLIEDTHSFFDLLTAMAFLYFKEKKVDWAVIEVGLGGRLDATNIIRPEAVAITSIGLDHVHILGNTLEAIAKEKGAIAKPGVPFIVGPSAAPFYPHALAVGRAPFYDLENQLVARAVLEKLGFSERAIVQGLNARPACRFEMRGSLETVAKLHDSRKSKILDQVGEERLCLSGSPDGGLPRRVGEEGEIQPGAKGRFYTSKSLATASCIFDVAHNPPAFQKLVEALLLHFPSETFHFVVAFTKEKDWRSCLDLIAPIAARITALRGRSNRLVPPEQIQAERAHIEIADSLEAIPPSSERKVVCGSFYIMASER